jgi:hypothetical protein
MRTIALLAGLLAGANSASADDAALLRCRALPDATARLACYDALPTAAGTSAAPSTTAATAATAAVGATAAKVATVAAPASAAAVAAAAAASAQAERFGYERKDELAEIVSRIPGPFSGWGPRTRFTLANGQIWQVSDESSAVYDLRDPKVTVRRATLSGFEMDIEGARRQPRVRRVD